METEARPSSCGRGPGLRSWRKQANSVRAERLGYRPELDGIRGLAIALVLAEHIFGVPLGGAQPGVSIFFVLSGFLITTLLLEEQRDTGKVSLRDFYTRRVFRLGPALLTLLVVYVVIVVQIQPDERAGRLWAAFFGLFYMADWPRQFGFTGGQELNPLWSLSVEEKFYLLWPAALIFLTRKGKVLPALAIGIVVFASVRLASAAFGWGLWQYSPQARFDEILVGCLVGVVWVKGLVKERDARRLGWVGILGLIAYFVAWRPVMTLEDAPIGFAVGLSLLAFSTAGLILGLVSGAMEPVKRVLSFKPLVVVGLLSYSLYLWHVFVRGAATWAGYEPTGWIILALSVLVATGSYLGIERPMLQYRKRRKLQPADQHDRESGVIRTDGRNRVQVAP